MDELHKWTMESNAAELAADQTMDKFKAILDQLPEGSPERLEAETFLATVRMQHEMRGMVVGLTNACTLSGKRS
jgi:hypothetical protein